MRITSLVLHTEGSQEDIELDIRERRKSRYIVRNIAGVDAEELIPAFYSRALVSDSKYYEHHMKPREVVVRMALNPWYRTNESISSLRDRIYRLVSSSRTGVVQLQFKAGGTVAKVISGLITKVEASLFTKTPELQVTVRCEDPVFRSPVPVDYELSDLPSANPLVVTDHSSTASHGFSFKVEFTAAVAVFTIQDKAASPEWKWEVGPTGGFAIGDELHFSSEFRNKLVYLQGASSKHLMDKVLPNSVWPLIFPSINELYFPNIASFDWIEFNYYSAYWGL